MQLQQYTGHLTSGTDYNIDELAQLLTDDSSREEILDFWLHVIKESGKAQGQRDLQYVIANDCIDIHYSRMFRILFLNPQHRAQLLLHVNNTFGSLANMLDRFVTGSWIDFKLEVNEQVSTLEFSLLQVFYDVLQDDTELQSLWADSLFQWLDGIIGKLGRQCIPNDTTPPIQRKTADYGAMLPHAHYLVALYRKLLPQYKPSELAMDIQLPPYVNTSFIFIILPKFPFNIRNRATCALTVALFDDEETLLYRCLAFVQGSNLLSTDLRQEFALGKSTLLTGLYNGLFLQSDGFRDWFLALCEQKLDGPNGLKDLFNKGAFSHDLWQARCELMIRAARRLQDAPDEYLTDDEEQQRAHQVFTLLTSGNRDNIDIAFKMATKMNAKQLKNALRDYVTTRSDGDDAFKERARTAREHVVRFYGGSKLAAIPGKWISDFDAAIGWQADPLNGAQKQCSMM